MHNASTVNSSAAPTAPALSITDFLTDGSLAALCAELSQLTGVPVQLRDALGRLVSPGGRGKESWSVSEESLAKPPPGAHTFPLRVGGERIGAILVGSGGPSLSENPRLSLERAIELLAQASAELCEHELELRHKVKELSALFKLGSMLAHASGMERVLDVALESALDVLGLDAGSIMLLKEDADGITASNEEDLTVATSRNLSREWLDWPQSLSKGRLFDRLALGGEIVVSEDLSSDPRVQIKDRVQLEGLVSAIHAGMTFQSRPLGVMRLYAHDRRSFNESDRRLLGLIANQAAVAIEQARLLRLREEEQRIGRQLQLAADVQRRMLPSRVPQIRPLDIAARYIPSFELGGDFYDFIDLNGHLGIVVGDVVGKGIAAALLMSGVRASLRAHAQEVYDLDTVVGKVNQALCRDTLDSEFATLWYGVLNPATLRLTYCNAGHEPPIIVRIPKHRSPSPADIDELSVGGMVVGVDRSQRYQRAVYDLHPGDIFIAYTDGVTDASNFESAKFGKKRLRKTILDVLKAEPEAPAARVLDLIHWEVRRFTGLAPRADDETLLVMRINEPGK